MAENDCDRDWLEHTDAVLRGAGLRATAGRSAVVEHLARQRCLVTAQEIVDAQEAEIEEMRGLLEAGPGAPDAPSGSPGDGHGGH